MSDLISREDAIEAVCDAFCYAYCDNCENNMDEDLCGDCHRKYQNWSASRKTVEETIKSIPSADVPDTNVGEWIDMSNGGAIRNPWWESGKCDQCGKYGSKFWDYCPHCGSRNRKE